MKNLYLVKHSQSETYVVTDGWNNGEVEARRKVNDFLKERHFGGAQDTIISIKLIAQTETERTNNKFII
jgi:hypothetical protein